MDRCMSRNHDKSITSWSCGPSCGVRSPSSDSESRHTGLGIGRCSAHRLGAPPCPSLNRHHILPCRGGVKVMRPPPGLRHRASPWPGRCWRPARRPGRRHWSGKGRPRPCESSWSSCARRDRQTRRRRPVRRRHPACAAICARRRAAARPAPPCAAACCGSAPPPSPPSPSV
eukprot:scaffold24105_cov113-Isochrysis_galbana.AAC.10